MEEKHVMPPRNPVAVDFLNKSTANFKEALRKGEEYRKKPQFSLRKECPNCGSRRYHSLWGGAYNRLCADCNEAYNV